MREQLHKVYRDELSFDEFYLATANQWRRMADGLLRRWKAPPCVGVDDVVQMMLIGAWQALPRWESKRGCLEKFITFQAYTKAKRWVNTQRGVHNSCGDKLPSRHPIPEENIEEKAVVDPVQEDAVAAMHVLHATARRLDDRECYALAALVQAGSFDGAAAALYQASLDAELHGLLRITSVRHARRFVIQVAREVARME